MPVEVLRFEVEGEHIRQRNIETGGYVPDTLGFQIRRSLPGRCPQPRSLSNVIAVAFIGCERDWESISQNSR